MDKGEAEPEQGLDENTFDPNREYEIAEECEVMDDSDEETVPASTPFCQSGAGVR
jgi:hypothetical protein